MEENNNTQFKEIADLLKSQLSLLSDLLNTVKKIDSNIKIFIKAVPEENPDSSRTPTKVVPKLSETQLRLSEFRPNLKDVQKENPYSSITPAKVIPKYPETQFRPLESNYNLKAVPKENPASSRTLAKFIPRNSKPQVGFPEFNGKDPKEWIVKVEQYIKSNPTTADSLTLIDDSYMTGPAARWFDKEIRGKYTSGMLTFEKFCEILIEKFSIVPEIPEYNGKDPRKWISKADEFFEFNPMGDESKLKTVCQYMKGPLVQWFEEEVIKKNYKMSWLEFCKTLIKQFLIVPDFWSRKYRGEKQGKEFSVAFVNSNKHSFLNLKTAIAFECALVETKKRTVTFLAGDKEDDVVTTQTCMNFRWEMNSFGLVVHEVIVVPISGCDLVLGADWIRKRDIIFDSEKNTVQMEYGSQVYLEEKHEIIQDPEFDATKYSMKLTYPAPGQEPPVKPKASKKVTFNI